MHNDKADTPRTKRVYDRCKQTAESIFDDFSEMLQHANDLERESAERRSVIEDLTASLDELMKAHPSETAPNCENTGTPTGDPHPLDERKFDKQGEESKRTQFARWWERVGRNTMEPSHAAWIAWLERDRLGESAQSATTETTVALRRLMKEAAAVIALAEPQIRDACGHTNFACLQNAVNEAAAALERDRVREQSATRQTEWLGSLIKSTDKCGRCGREVVVSDRGGNHG